MDNHSVENSAAAAYAPRLIDQVAEILRAAGHPNPTGWFSHAQLHPDAQRRDVAPDVQRFLINRVWRFELAQLQARENIDTMDVRYSLVDNGKIEDWLQLFAKDVTPWIVKHNLPRQQP